MRRRGVFALRHPGGVGDVLSILRQDAARRARRAVDRAVRAAV